MNVHASPSTSSDTRLTALRRLLATKRSITIIEAHSPISALIAENARFHEGGGVVREFDGFWSSSLTDSASRGLPDIEILDVSRRLDNINEIFQVTTKPLVMDGDTGGRTEHFVRHVRNAERVGVSALVIEDKTGAKRNSLFGSEQPHELADVAEFSEKISAGKSSQLGPDFMIIARLESLIVGHEMQEALNRASAFVDAGADGVMIHSRKKTPDEVIEFARHFRQVHPAVPLMCVPTSYSHVYSSELEAAGFNIIAYANHMLRAAYKAMDSVSRDILQHGRAAEVEERCVDIPKMLNLFPV